MSHNMVLGLYLMGYGLFCVFFVLAAFILLINIIVRVCADKPKSNAD